MEIPGNDFRIKNKTIQDRVKVGDKSAVDNHQVGKSLPSGTEQIAISSKAKNIQKASEVINATPDIRIEKVDRIKGQIANGSYHVSSEQLAEKVLENIISDSKFLG
jgi:negative regulator of flagellin synthesis FlgM